MRNLVSKDKIYYTRFDGTICECKVTKAIQYYMPDTNRLDDRHLGYRNRDVEFELLLANGKRVADGITVHRIYSTIEDCKKGIYHINIHNFEDECDVISDVIRLGLAKETRNGRLVFYRWNGFAPVSHENAVIAYDILNGELSIEKGQDGYELYKTAQDCENDHKVTLVRFSESEHTESENEKRIKELKTIIENAQRELNKINNF